MAVPASVGFISSLVSDADYPSNLLSSNCSAHQLRSYRDRLHRATPTLCLTKEVDAYVCFRDWDSVSRKYRRQNVLAEAALYEWLGSIALVQSRSGDLGNIRLTKRAPKSRFIFLHSKRSRDHLYLTKIMLVHILSYHQVMPQYLDMLFLFGRRQHRQDLRYSAFRSRNHLAPLAPNIAIPELNRSGRYFEICYNIKTVISNESLGQMPQVSWPIRQAAVYHYFDTTEGTANWIIAYPGLDLKKEIEDATGINAPQHHRDYNHAQNCFVSSLNIHTLLISWSTEPWMGYIQHMESILEKLTNAALYEDETTGLVRTNFSKVDVQSLQILSYHVNEIVSTLKDNCAIATSLQEHYRMLLNNADFEMASHVTEQTNTFCEYLEQIEFDLKKLMHRGQLLTQELTSRREIVLLQLQSQNSENAYSVAVAAQRDATAMRIITVVTLLYLPATFVSTFFSTDVVKYEANGATSFSSIALQRWLQLTLPLTAVTAVGALYAYHKSMESRGKKLRVLSSDDTI